MNKTKLLVLLFLLSPFIYSRAQDCSVEKAEIKGSYSGDCKKGKANGKGKAAGTDSYEGDFRAGLPDGNGTYKWSNGNEYTGAFAKGLKEGRGTLVYKKLMEATVSSRDFGRRICM
jgi:hypothetical protein